MSLAWLSLPPTLHSHKEDPETLSSRDTGHTQRRDTRMVSDILCEHNRVLEMCV